MRPLSRLNGTKHQNPGQGFQGTDPSDSSSNPTLAATLTPGFPTRAGVGRGRRPLPSLDGAAMQVSGIRGDP